MIRRLALTLMLLPCAAMAQSPSSSTAPCGASRLAPLPTSVPVPEMLRVQPAVTNCINLLSYVERVRRPVGAPPAAAPAAPTGAPGPGGDQMAYRFYMTQNGRQMTSDEFDAWMKSKGVRVATGRAAPATVQPAAGSQVLPAAPTATVPAAAPATSGCVASATVSC